MRLAMMARIFVIGTSEPGGGCGVAGLAGAAVLCPTLGDDGAVAEDGAPGFSRCPRMSCLVMRPETPVAGTVERSTLFSLAILRTSGEDRWPSPVDAAGAAWAGVATGADAATGVGGAAAGAAAGADAPPPMTATTVLTVTVAPSWTLISVSVPATGEGISASTLSVEISKMGSSRAIVSPTFLSHLVMVPSVMDSPIWGIMTSVPGPVVGGAGAVAAAEAATSLAAVATAAGVTVSSLGAGEGGAAAPSSLMVQTTVLMLTVAPS